MPWGWSVCFVGSRNLRGPDGFLRLETGGDELKATTPDGARLWVREFDDRDCGTLAFWAEAVENDLVENRGYVRDRGAEIEDADGHPGRLQRYSATAAGEPHGYLIAIFVIEGVNTNTIRTAEFTAPRATFDAHAAAVEAALRTIE
jgi:hypothetical protein